MVIKQALRIKWHLWRINRSTYNEKQLRKHAKKLLDAVIDIEYELFGCSKYEREGWP